MSIDGVVVKELVTRADERGFFREVIRETDGFFDHFGQWSHSLMYPGATKAWHVHLKQTDWWYVIGTLKVALYDTREGSPTKGQLMELLMGDLHATCLKIPPGTHRRMRAGFRTTIPPSVTTGPRAPPSNERSLVQAPPYRGGCRFHRIELRAPAP
jgi:dTDP-4-dehydrorhamnose 3,5-epimerase